ncbi:MAG: glycerol-3-phosphate dehydrogenase/oxidase [Chryseolinea sp.]
MAFSCIDRSPIVQKLSTESFDLIVIGGGITGAGIALDAASRGIKTALLEKNDFAFGTSSRSTKLIHGGLRYLKQLEFGLVKEVGSERAVVHKLAPHLVVPEKMLLPLSEKNGLGYWLTSIGLKIYDWLAGVKPEDQRKMLTKIQTLKYEPLLRKEDVNGGAIYAEYRTDDARLTIEIIKEAVNHGATILNYAKVIDFIYRDGIITGVQVQEQHTSVQFVVNGKVAVSAAGPWVDELREINKSKMGKRLHLTKGVHIVVSHERFPIKQAIYFEVEDGRMIFAIPRGKITYIGTTDTNYSGATDDVWAASDDVRYLVNGVNAMFPSVQLKIDDIESSWAGLRPLIHEEGKSASELSRKDEIFESETGLVSIAGGKLTGYRKMAERVVNLIVKKHFEQKELKQCFTEQIVLAKHQFKNVKQVAIFTEGLQADVLRLGLDKSMCNYLVENYGPAARDIVSKAAELTGSTDGDINLLMAELDYCLSQEMVCTLSDFFVRRTGLLNFNISRVVRWKDQIASICQEAMGWDEFRMASELRTLEESLVRVKNFV